MNRKVGGSHNVKRMLSFFPPPPPLLHLAPSALSTTYLPPCDTWNRETERRDSVKIHVLSASGEESRAEDEEEEEEGRDTTPLSAAEWQGGTKEKLF